MKLCASVVVPTYKRPCLLDRCLAALMTQDFDPANYEVIIVDDACCEATRQQVACWQERVRASGHRLHYVARADGQQSRGPAAARNLGWRAAHGEIIAFTDDDCIPAPQWLQAGVMALSGSIAAASGRIVVPISSTPTDYEYNAALLENSEFVTANCFYRRDMLQQVNGFDERFTAAWREDTDLFFTVLKHNFTRTYAPEAVVIHLIRSAQWGISLSQQRKSEFNALLYKKHPELYRQKVQTSPPWHYYRILGGLLLICLGITSKSRIGTWVGLAIWLPMTGHFCFQRLRNTTRRPGHVAEMLLTSFLIPPLAIFWRLRGMIKFRVFFL